MPKKKGKHRRVVKEIVPSHLCLVTLMVADLKMIRDPGNLRQFTNRLIELIGMKKIGKPRIDMLRSGLPGVWSYSINQPIVTSIVSIDTWPEMGENGHLLVLIHSCQTFRYADVKSAFRQFFPGSRIIKKTWLDHSVAITKEKHSEQRK